MMLSDLSAAAAAADVVGRAGIGRLTGGGIFPVNSSPLLTVASTSSLEGSVALPPDPQLLLDDSIVTTDEESVAAPYPDFVVGPFEGVEKRLIVQFSADTLLSSPVLVGGSLRSIPPQLWQTVLDHAVCQILSHVELETEDGACTAYLLSESSLFVYDSRIILKTCGTTTPLLVLPSLMNLLVGGGYPPIVVGGGPCTKNDTASVWSQTTTAESLLPPLLEVSSVPSPVASSLSVPDEALENIGQRGEGTVSQPIISWLMFSHLTYCFPEKQKYPHGSNQEEIEYLEWFLATVNCPFECVPGESTVSTQSLVTSADREFFFYAYRNPRIMSLDRSSLLISELMMMEIDEDCVDQFAGRGSGFIASGESNDTTTTLLGRLLLDTHCRHRLDQFWFTPCGYSCNLLTEAGGTTANFTTAHISPEKASSYASLEATYPFRLRGKSTHRHELAHEEALECFRPRHVHVVEVRLNCGHRRFLGGRTQLVSKSGALYKLLTSQEFCSEWLQVRHTEYYYLEKTKASF